MASFLDQIFSQLKAEILSTGLNAYKLCLLDFTSCRILQEYTLERVNNESPLYQVKTIDESTELQNQIDLHQQQIIHLKASRAVSEARLRNQKDQLNNNSNLKNANTTSGNFNDYNFKELTQSNLKHGRKRMDDAAVTEEEEEENSEDMDIVDEDKDENIEQEDDEDDLNTLNTTENTKYENSNNNSNNNNNNNNNSNDTRTATNDNNQTEESDSLHRRRSSRLRADPLVNQAVSTAPTAFSPSKRHKPHVEPAADERKNPLHLQEEPKLDCEVQIQSLVNKLHQGWERRHLIQLTCVEEASLSRLNQSLVLQNPDQEAPNIIHQINCIVASSKTIAMVGRYFRAVLAFRLKKRYNRGFQKKFKEVFQLSKTEGTSYIHLYQFIMKHYAKQTESIQALLQIPIFLAPINWEMWRNTLLTSSGLVLIKEALKRFHSLVPISTSIFSSSNINFNNSSNNDNNKNNIDTNTADDNNNHDHNDNHNNNVNYDNSDLNTNNNNINNSNHNANHSATNDDFTDNHRLNSNNEKSEEPLFITFQDRKYGKLYNARVLPTVLDGNCGYDSLIRGSSSLTTTRSTTTSSSNWTEVEQLKSRIFEVERSFISDSCSTDPFVSKFKNAYCCDLNQTYEDLLEQRSQPHQFMSESEAVIAGLHLFHSKIVTVSHDEVDPTHPWIAHHVTEAYKAELKNNVLLEQAQSQSCYLLHCHADSPLEWRAESRKKNHWMALQIIESSPLIPFSALSSNRLVNAHSSTVITTTNASISDWMDSKWIELYQDEQLQQTGVRATRDIPLGRVKKQVILDLKAICPVFQVDDANDIHDSEACQYSFQLTGSISPPQFLDLRLHWAGKINHLPTPKANLQITGSGKLTQIKSIRTGEALSLDYGVDFWVYQLTHLELEEWRKRGRKRAEVFYRMHEMVDNYQPLLKKQLWTHVSSQSTPKDIELESIAEIIVDDLESQK